MSLTQPCGVLLAGKNFATQSLLVEARAKPGARRQPRCALGPSSAHGQGRTDLVMPGSDRASLCTKAPGHEKTGPAKGAGV